MNIDGGVSPDLLGRLRRIKMIVVDVQGVLTNDVIYLSLPDGSDTAVTGISGKDALRVNAALASDLQVLLFDMQPSAITRYYQEVLGVDMMYKHDATGEPMDLFDEVRRFNVIPEEVLYIGNDWDDLSFMHGAGVSAAPADATAQNIREADIVTKAPGGRGVLAEVIEQVLQAQDKLHPAIRAVFPEHVYKEHSS